MKTRYILSFLFLWQTSSICQVKPAALADGMITSLTIAENSYENLVIAGTENEGLYFHDFKSDDSAWTQVSFVNRSISCIYAQRRSSSLTKLFMALKPDSTIDNTLIYSNILPVQSAIPEDDYGLDKNKVKLVKSISGFDYPGQVFCCTNDPNVYVYKDSTWSTAWSGPETAELNFVYAKDSTVWAGGYNNSAGRTALLIKSTDYGKSWQNVNLPSGPGDTCYSICVLSGTSDVLFLGMNEKILKSTDGGNSWKRSLDNIKNVVFTCFASDPLKYGEIFAGGKSNDNAFTLYKSIDGGVTWMPVEYYCNCVVKGINSLAGIVQGDKYTLFIATNGDGIWKYPAKPSGNKNQNIINSEYYLYQNTPNPFNPETKISFEIPVGGKISLIIYDIVGREVAMLIDNKYKSAGYYSVMWDSKNLYGRPAASGVYICRLVYGNQSKIIKMTLSR